MVRLTRRELFAATGALGLAGASGCGASQADARFARSLEPHFATLPEGVRLEVHPGRIRLESGRALVRAAAPSLAIELAADAPASISLTIENLPAGAEISPAPAAARWARPGVLELELEVEAGITRLEIGSEAAPGEGLRFAVVSDVHTNLSALAAIVADLNQRRPQLVLCMGDLADHGTRGELDEVLAALERLEIPFYSTLGNHEDMGDASPYFEERIGPANLTFDHGGVRFVLVDSSSASIAPGAWGWLEAQLRGRSGPAFVFTHVPPLDVSGWRSHGFRIRDEALRFVELLAATGTDRLFVGHVHDFAEYELAGVPVSLTGGGGKVKEWAAGVGLHYLEVEVGAAGEVRVLRRDV